MTEVPPPPTPPGSQPDPAPPRLLRRSTEDRVIAGVCGGLARYLGIDPAIVRIAFVLLALFGGSGLIAYIIGWIAIPEAQPGEGAAATGPASPDGLRVALGAVLILLGAALLVGRLVPRVSEFIGPLLLVGLGVVLIVGLRR